MANSLASWSGTWKEYDWKAGNWEVWEGGCGWVSPIGYSLCSMWMCTKEKPEQRSLFIIKWKKVDVLWLLVSPFPQTPLFFPVSSRTDDDGGRDGGYPCSAVWASSQQGWLVVATPMCPTCQQKRPMLSPGFVTTFWGKQAVICWQVDCTGPHPFGRDGTLFSLKWQLAWEFAFLM